MISEFQRCKSSFLLRAKHMRRSAMKTRQIRSEIVERCRVVLNAKLTELTHKGRRPELRNATPSHDFGDTANDRGEKEVAVSLSETDSRLRRAVLAALQRVRDGEYGFCQQCGGLLAEKRLEAVPWAAFCV